MIDLLSIAEQAHSQLFPNPTDETAIDKEEFQATAKSEYAYQMWRKSKEDRRETGERMVPDYLLSTKEFDVKDNIIDLSGVGVLMVWEEWLQNIGGVRCECRYVKTTVNLAQALCDDDSLPEGDKLYYLIGRQIHFPNGVHKTPLPIIYANNGELIDGRIEVDDAVAGVIRTRLIEIYGGKVGQEDKTNNSNPNK